MKAEQIVQYLQENHQFFEDYADVLAQIHIPHPHGGRAIPISERQILSLREKNRALESKLGELIEFGEENDSISEKIHRLTLNMMRVTSFDELMYALYLNMHENFSIPHVALRIWNLPSLPEMPEFSPVSKEAIIFAESLTTAYCSDHAMFDTLTWFPEEAGLHSFAYIPLRGEQSFGLLALASDDPQRFYPEMGTLYLKRLGELISAAIQHQLKT